MLKHIFILFVKGEETPKKKTMSNEEFQLLSENRVCIFFNFFHGNGFSIVGNWDHLLLLIVDEY